MSQSSLDQISQLFAKHLQFCKRKLSSFLERKNSQAILFDAGAASLYFCDDQKSPFRSSPYFRYLCPLKGEKHFIIFSPQLGLELYVYEPISFWDDISYRVEESYWADSFDRVHYLRSEDELKKALSAKKNFIYIGPDFNRVQDFKQINPKELISALNWWRCQKTEYEIFCLDEANKRGLLPIKK